MQWTPKKSRQGTSLDRNALFDLSVNRFSLISILGFLELLGTVDSNKLKYPVESPNLCFILNLHHATSQIVQED